MCLERQQVFSSTVASRQVAKTTHLSNPSSSGTTLGGQTTSRLRLVQSLTDLHQAVRRLEVVSCTSLLPELEAKAVGSFVQRQGDMQH